MFKLISNIVVMYVDPGVEARFIITIIFYHKSANLHSRNNNSPLKISPGLISSPSL